MKKKFMGVEYSINKNDNGRFAWSVTSSGLFGSGAADSSKGAQEHAEAWIRSKKK